jgi:hypothetical protein
MVRNKLILLTIIASILLAVAVAAQSVTIDSGTYPGVASSIAKDGNTLYVSAVDNDGYDLVFYRSTNRGSAWTAPIVVDDVNQVNSIAAGTSIGLAGSGTVHIAYISDGDIRLATSTDDGDTWSHASTGVTGSSPSLAVIGSTLYIAYKTVDGGLRVRKSTNGGSSWSTQIIELVDILDVGIVKNQYPSIDAVDANTIAVAYIHKEADSNLDLYVATTSNGGTLWSTELVDAAWTTKNPSIDMLSSTQIYIAYQYITPVSYGREEGLKFAEYDGSIWTTEIVDGGFEGVRVGMYSDLVVVDASTAYITYYDGNHNYMETTNKDLKVATWDGLVWTTQTVVTTDDSGASSSLVVDGDDLYVSYYSSDGSTSAAAFVSSFNGGVSWDQSPPAGAGYPVETVTTIFNSGYTIISKAVDDGQTIMMSELEDVDIGYRYNGAGWDLYVASAGLGDFALQEGEAYFVYSENGGEISFTGTPYTFVPTTNPGFNIMGVPQPMTLGDVITQTGCGWMYAWNGNGYVVSNGVFNANYVVNAGEGVWAYC